MRPYSKRTEVSRPLGSAVVISRAPREVTSRAAVDVTAGGRGPGAVRKVRFAPREIPAGFVATRR